MEVTRTSPELRSKWCTPGGVRTHYLDVDRAGSGIGVLIVHGYLGSTVSFLELIDILSRDLRVVMPDLPGFGASDVPDCRCTMEYYLEFLERFAAAVDLDHFYIMGTSLGANIVSHYAVGHPDQVRGLICLSPFGLENQAGRMAQIKRWDAFLPLATSLITRNAVQRRLRRSILRDALITPELVDAYWNPFTSPEGRRAVLEVTRWIVGACSMDEILPRIEQPVLILAGSEDKLLGAVEREKLQRLLRTEKFETIEESGHFLYLDAPDVVSSKIVRFTRGGVE